MSKELSPITTHRVLWILEPESEFRSILVELAIQYGNETYAIGELDQAWTALDSKKVKSPPEIVIADCRMPGAFDWLRALCERYPRAQVVCLATESHPSRPSELPPQVHFYSRPEELSALIQLIMPE